MLALLPSFVTSLVLWKSKSSTTSTSFGHRRAKSLPSYCWRCCRSRQLHATIALVPDRFVMYPSGIARNCFSSTARSADNGMALHFGSIGNDGAAPLEQIVYGIGGVELSQRWIELVNDGHVSAVTVLKDSFLGSEEEWIENEPVSARYGVRLDGPPHQRRLLEFVDLLPSQKEDRGNPGDEIRTTESCQIRKHVLSIISTLAKIQKQHPEELTDAPMPRNFSKFQQSATQSNSTRGLEKKIPESSNAENNTRHQHGLAIQCIHDGPYAAQLQLVRTLRPPRSQNMQPKASSRVHSDQQTSSVSCTPPPYDPAKDSFLVGNLRLFGHGQKHGSGEPRVRAAKLWVPRDTSIISNPVSSPCDNTFKLSHFDWDVYHNVSPVDPRGHFLLLPALDHHPSLNWRDQSLTSPDCHDMSYLASTIHPPGSMMLSFNSVGAGASQNHIHCHAWVSPPPPFLQLSNEKNKAIEGARQRLESRNPHGYAVTAALASTSDSILHLAKGTTVSLLEYPCTCIKLSTLVPTSMTSSINNHDDAGDHATIPIADMNINEEFFRKKIDSREFNAHFSSLKEVGSALAKIVEVAQKLEAPHNVAWSNSEVKSTNGTENVVSLDAYVFFRSKAECYIPVTSSNTQVNRDTIFRLGASEMLGLFHCSSEEQLVSLSGCMDQILKNVSLEPRSLIWEKVCNALEEHKSLT